jgi:hypothetical protein
VIIGVQITYKVVDFGMAAPSGKDNPALQDYQTPPILLEPHQDIGFVMITHEVPVSRMANCDNEDSPSWQNENTSGSQTRLP